MISTRDWARVGNMHGESPGRSLRVKEEKLSEVQKSSEKRVAGVRAENFIFCVLVRGLGREVGSASCCSGALPSSALGSVVLKHEPGLIPGLIPARSLRH